MRYLKAFLFGALAAIVLVGGAFAVVSAVATSGGLGDLAVGVGPILVLEVRRAGNVTESTISMGFALLALVAGFLNAGALAAIARRARQSARRNA